MEHIGESVRTLRIIHHETQKSLAESIGLKEPQINMIEKGKRKLSLKHAVDIANHYWITVDELVRGFECTEDEPVRIMLKKEHLPVLIKTLFPVVCTNEALCDQDFKLAHKIHSKDFINSIKQSGEINIEQFARCWDLYKRSWNTTKSPETAANILSLIMLASNSITKVDESALRRRIMLAGGVDITTMWKFALNGSDNIHNTDKEKCNFAKRNNKTVLECLSALKKNEQWSDLADYYIALRYLVGMVDMPNSDKYYTMGFDFMRLLVELNNKYAIESMVLFDLLLGKT